MIGKMGVAMARAWRAWIAMFAFLLWSMIPTAPAAASCPVPNQISNGQVADATQVMGNFNALSSCINQSVTTTGSPAAGNLTVFSSGGSISGGNLSGDCTTIATLSVTCTKTNGASFGYFATGTDGSQLTGTISTSRFSSGTNADSSHFLRGDGVWAVPSGGGGGSGLPWYLAFRPVSTDFTAVSGDANTITMSDDADVGLQFNVGTVVTGDKWRGGEKTIPSPTADWTVTAKIVALTPAVNYRGAGLYIRDGVGGKIVSFNRYNGDSVEVTRWGGLSGSWNSRILDLPNVGNFAGWYRITYTASDNTYRFYYSLTGKQWALVASELQTTYLANKANKIGFGGWLNGSAGPQTLGSVEYWQQSW